MGKTLVFTAWCNQVQTHSDLCWLLNPCLKHSLPLTPSFTQGYNKRSIFVKPVHPDWKWKGSL